MDKKQLEVIKLNEDILVYLQDKVKILSTRLEYLRTVEDNLFKPNNPNREFEGDAAFITGEKDLTINNLEDTIARAKGQVIAQEELLYKMSEEGEEEERLTLQMIRDNQDMKAEITDLKTGIEDLLKDISTDEPVYSFIAGRILKLLNKDGESKEDNKKSS